MKSNIEKHVILTKKLALSAVIALSLSACGSGGADDTPSTPRVQNITYEALPAILTFNEGETIRLSLNTKGEGANGLKFNWTVKYLNQDVTFSGQGSDTISFKAPNVETHGTMQVSVKLDEANSTKTIGFHDQHLSLNIKDLDPPVTPPASTHELGEEVSEIDTSALTVGSTWTETHKTNLRIDQVDNSYNLVDSTFIRSFIVESADQNKQVMGTNYCGFPDLNSMELNAGVLSVNCDSGTLSTQYFQKENSFSIVQKCDEKTVGVSTYEKKSNEAVASFGSLNMHFDNFADLQTKEVCGVVVTSKVTAHSADNQEVAKEEATAIRLVTQQEGNDFELHFAFNEAPNGFFVSLNSFFDENNKATIVSASYPELNTSSQSGSLDLDAQNSISNMKGKFNFVLKNDNGVGEAVEGDFELVLE
ncbi:hypothetical protein A7985_17800 [Pseudoalteromonas luteoviolacea]|uniref:PKD/Chitinase domain-containing protein n=1 Tax=Pseudoalteromonas luteoviolacea TaxID=43657 RepID=A0A1C0TMZ5_9GAMM|nr:hypothetical protein [Pseudoalteromonas luteoviolacea]OCQ20275.1 hypothetical protein A7985_17800 [Pseudoalteromonas luteoviolacea]